MISKQFLQLFIVLHSLSSDKLFVFLITVHAFLLQRSVIFENVFPLFSEFIIPKHSSPEQNISISLFVLGFVESNAKQNDRPFSSVFLKNF